MKIIANIVGLLAVVLFVCSYQLKTRRSILLCNIVSRALYVAQYVLLGAFEGAVLDCAALLVSIVCKNRDKGFIKKHLPLAVILSNLALVGTGLAMYRNIFSLLPLLGVLFETLALWPKREKSILRLSLLGAPFWLAYNLLCSAYASAIGNVITLASITLALLRQRKSEKAAPSQNSASQKTAASRG